MNTCMNCGGLSVKDYNGYCSTCSTFHVKPEPGGILAPRTKQTSEKGAAEGNGYQKQTSGKLDWTLLPWPAIKDLVALMQVVADRGGYPRDNWQHCDPEDYKRACMRHLEAIFEDEDIDPGTGKSHWCAVMFNAAVCRWHEIQKETKSSE